MDAATEKQQMSKPTKQQTKKPSIRDCLIAMCNRIDQWDDNRSIPTSALTRLVADARSALKRFRESRKSTGGMAKSPGRPVNEKLRLAILAESLDRKPELVASKVGCSSKHVRNVRKEAISNNLPNS